uniref:Receptor-type tyrosine-protein phosphatase kappa n=1 Tax=Magallana gigas TaxID=29159 RepID=K1PSX9_MAGGI
MGEYYYQKILQIIAKCIHKKVYRLLLLLSKSSDLYNKKNGVDPGRYKCVPLRHFYQDFLCCSICIKEASAGIGRTGTYIAIDVLSETGKTHNKINIAEYVKKMRRNRMNMVQTYEQYKTIFLTLHELFKAQPTVLCTAEFFHKSQTDSSAFKKEFQV